MRILLVSDLHSNRPALEAVREDCDVCLCLGDLVDYGLDPAPCVAWARRNPLVTVRGNHDHGVAQNVPVSGRNGYKYLTGVTRPLTRERLSPDDLYFLAKLPVSRLLTLDKMRFFLVHATPRDPLDEYAAADAEFWRRRLQRVEADVVCVGHSHQSFELDVDGVKVINPGSVGLSRDGDPRAS